MELCRAERLVAAAVRSAVLARAPRRTTAAVAAAAISAVQRSPEDGAAACQPADREVAPSLPMTPAVPAAVKEVRAARSERRRRKRERVHAASAQDEMEVELDAKVSGAVVLPPGATRAPLRATVEALRAPTASTSSSSPWSGPSTGAAPEARSCAARGDVSKEDHFITVRGAVREQIAQARAGGSEAEVRHLTQQLDLIEAMLHHARDVQVGRKPFLPVARPAEGRPGGRAG
mmetsp:Transcript_17159/g.53000  ORF Transcript_17159/g.53000 Transcript_17159/m.53000 type:complete len:233 (-) Transcript_17159:63-761(-)